ncbi:uncharacterized protein DSM5745_04502 [Aspergillus mulundensis]|uniref:Uncharacterized protein n=1 Tax=Aspergillus mulundensis TaxID=1810919 RepID=A0A3D8SCW2_9EURO|nr:hypothetical protein DSM5745_04502 [Aspergillus mulundensis]RDW84176.1 hypothetical protein DSM5745_04502 [Aspergillus mulundensis]
MSSFLPLLPLPSAPASDQDWILASKKDGTPSSSTSKAGPALAFEDPVREPRSSEKVFEELALVLSGHLQIDAFTDVVGPEEDEDSDMEDLSTENSIRSGTCLLDDSDLEGEEEDEPPGLGSGDHFDPTSARSQEHFALHSWCQND